MCRERAAPVDGRLFFSLVCFVLFFFLACPFKIRNNWASFSWGPAACLRSDGEKTRSELFIGLKQRRAVKLGGSKRWKERSGVEQVQELNRRIIKENTLKDERMAKPRKLFLTAAAPHSRCCPSWKKKSCNETRTAHRVKEKKIRSTAHELDGHARRKGEGKVEREGEQMLSSWEIKKTAYLQTKRNDGQI